MAKNFTSRTTTNKGKVYEKFEREKFVVYLIKKYSMFNYKGVTYFKINGEYSADTRELRKIIDIEWKESDEKDIKEIILKINYRAEEKELAINQYAIKFRNGVLDTKTMTFEKDSKDFFLNTLDYNFDIEKLTDLTKLKHYDSIMNVINQLFLNKKDAVKELLQHLSKALIPSMKGEKATILYGKPGTGKSTILNLLMNVLGSKNYAGATSFDNYNDPNGVLKVVGKLAAIGHENQHQNVIKDITNFKGGIHGQPIPVKQLYKDISEVSLYAKCYWNYNRPVKISQDDIEAYEDRVDILLFPSIKRVKGTQEDKTIKDNFLTNKEYGETALYILINELKDYYANNETIPSTKMSQAGRREWWKEANPIKAFIDSKSREYFIGKFIEQADEDYCSFNNVIDDEAETNKRGRRSIISRIACERFDLITKREMTQETIAGNTYTIKKTKFVENNNFYDKEFQDYLNGGDE